MPKEGATYFVLMDLDTIGYYLYMEDQEKQAAVQKELNELAALLDAGIIIQEEFDEKKRELLGQ